MTNDAPVVQPEKSKTQKSLALGAEIKSVFQPLVSIKRQAVFGYEALSRGYCKENNRIISPMELFASAHTRKDLLTLDRRCRETAVSTYAKALQHNRGRLLSLNFDASIIDRSILGSRHLLNSVQQAGLAPHNVIIEIIESKVIQEDVLMDFVNLYKSFGFLIALDDIGAGHSNLDRIPMIRPDVIKIDRSLISNIHESWVAREVVRSLVNLSNNTGALAIAEGVEKLDEVLACMELGVDAFQGFYFNKPGSLEAHAPREQMRAAAAAFKERTVERISERKKRHGQYTNLATSILKSLELCEPSDFERTLKSAATSYPELECVYVLDDCGMQITDSICNLEKINETRRFLYHPAPTGSDHSLKDYYLPITAGLERFTTESYVSLASGNRCRTIATSFFTTDGHKCVLCLDITVGENDPQRC